MFFAVATQYFKINNDPTTHVASQEVSILTSIRSASNTV